MGEHFIFKVGDRVKRSTGDFRFRVGVVREVYRDSRGYARYIIEPETAIRQTHSKRELTWLGEDIWVSKTERDNEQATEETEPRGSRPRDKDE